MINNAYHYEDYVKIEIADDKLLSKEEQLYMDIEDWQAPSEDGKGYNSLTIQINGIYYSNEAPEYYRY